MAKPKDPPEPKRLNRTVAVSDALSGVLDAALRKRGFATRDIITNWRAIAPRPYDALTLPDELKWPRGAGHEGATLYLRCAPGQALAVSHEAPQIAAAVNRYFGYFLVREVRLSAEPMGVARVETPRPAPVADDATRAAVTDVADPGLKEALATLGIGIKRRRR